MQTEIQQSIAKAEVILVLAGAGMSADSGLPTYRDREGFWNAYPLYRELSKDYERMMSPYGLQSDPAFAWGFFAHQYRLYHDALPHQGYKDLLALCQQKQDYFIVTTNIDGLFLKAGFPSNHLHQAHGSIHTLQCSIPCQRTVWEIDRLDVEVDYTTMRAKEPLPRCPHCGSVARPNIFMFGDSEESYIWEYGREQAKAFRAWRERHLHRQVLILEIGVGAEGMKRHAQTYYREFPHATLIRINPIVDTAYPDEVIQMRCGALEGIAALQLSEVL